jgi:ABC-type transporter Mla MlaB component
MTPTATYYAVAPPVTRADIPVLCADLAERLRGRAGGVVICDVAQVYRPDVVTVEALARLRLTARRHGWKLVVSGAGPRLVELVGLLGLGDALTEVGRQPEEREQVGRVEEVVDVRDPPV